MAAPLTGINVVEFAGLAPGPFAGLVLADWGANVIRIDRVGQTTTQDILCRGKRSISVNPKTKEGGELLVKLITKADVLIDPFRPGVLEKFGLGPDVFLDNGINDRLIYARLAGFPRKGDHKDMAGHDLNYLALSGVLSMFSGTDEKPTFPLNLLADFAGGGLMCALGVLLALLSRSQTEKGQVVEVDMVSGTRYLSTFPLVSMLANGTSPLFGEGDRRAKNVLDGGAPQYNVYSCKDGKCMSIGCLEPDFASIFFEKFFSALDLGPSEWRPDLNTLFDRNEWPKFREFLETGFRTKTRDEWTKIFHGTDACVVPVLSPSEAAALSSSVPAPHPNLSISPASQHSQNEPVLLPGQHTLQILKELNIGEADKSRLFASGAVGAGEKARL